MKGKIVRTLIGLLSASLILTMTGCTDKGQTDQPVVEAQATPTPTPAEENNTPEPAPAKIDDNGKPIIDFDEFVNGEWLKEQEEGDAKTVAAAWKKQEQILDRVKDILENTDPSTLPEDSGLAKSIRLYREAIDTEDMEGRIKDIRDYLAAIDSIKSTEDLCKLSAKEEYSICDTVIRFVVMHDENGYNTEVFSPYNTTNSIKNLQGIITGDDPSTEKEAALAYWNALGYSEERLTEILDNALKVSEILDEYYGNADYNNNLIYWDQEHLDRKGLNVPVIDILRELNGYGRYEEVLAPESMIDLLNSLYTAENVKMLRDNYLYHAGMELYAVSAYGAYISGSDEDQEKYKDSFVDFMCSAAGDVLAEEYKKRFQEDGMYENAEILADEIKNELMTVLGEADWLGDNSRRALKAKIARMSYFLGTNGYVNELTDFYISGNYIEDFLNLKIDRKRFMRSQAKYEDDKRLPFQAYMMVENGEYFRKSNMFVLCAGSLTSSCMKNDAAYEERLARVGMTMAHEMSHTLTPDSIYYDEHGMYNEILSDAEYDELWDRAGAIAEYFDGVEIAEGKSLNGWAVEDESFADLLGMKICLNLLAKQEDPDYDLFFRCWADNKAFYLAEEDVDSVFADPHLPGKLRVNCIPAQFDIFYEIYDIDESSTFYVPADKRLKTY